MLSTLASLLLAGAAVLDVANAGLWSERFNKIQDRHATYAAEQRVPHFKEQLDERSSKFRFLTNDTAKFQVKSLPDVPYDVGEMYSGLVPIDSKNASRALFFVFEPKLGAPVDEITIWLNGGPGCSSLEGFFQENGRFQWQPGTFAPVESAYSWVNLTNVLWVEQPVGTGFSIGEKRVTSEEDVGAEFTQWFLNWQKTFGISKFKIYVTGESYAGRYVPYISAAMLDKKDKTHFDLHGALVYDPVIGEFVTQQVQVPTLPFVQAQQTNLNLNATFLAQLEKIDKDCGFAAYREKYLTFPPSGQQPPTYFNYTSNSQCDINDIAMNGIFEVNPCFNPYATNQNCPILWDVLGFPGALDYTPPGSEVYFNRTDVKKAMHAPLDVSWSECAGNPFVGNGGPQDEGDESADPIQKVLPQVIEATNRVLVSNGDYDMVIITNGTLLAIQNMTWNGKLGFQSAPSTPIDITLPDLQYQDIWCSNGDYYCGLDGPNQGIMGISHYERGLMWAQTYQSGHMQPQFQPRAAYRHLQWVLGHVQTL